MKGLFTFTGVKANKHTQPWELFSTLVSLFTLFLSNLDAMKPLTGLILQNCQYQLSPEVTSNTLSGRDGSSLNLSYDVMLEPVQSISQAKSSGYSSMVRRLPSMHRVLGSSPSSIKKQELANQGAGEMAEGLKECILLWAGSSPRHVGRLMVTLTPALGDPFPKAPIHACTCAHKHHLPTHTTPDTYTHHTYTIKKK